MKAIGDLFSELTDLDKGYLRTILTLIRNPKKVVDAYLVGETPYTKPLRFALISASVYFILANLYAFFFDSPVELLVWINPKRTIEYFEKLENLKSGFDPFLQLITIIPLSILLLKLLFRKKKWVEISVIVLYAFAVYWLILIIFIPIPDFTFSALFKPLTALIMVFVCFRNIIQGRLVSSLARWLVLSIALILWVDYVANPLTSFVLTKVAFKNLSTGIIKPDAPDPLSVKTLELPEDAPHQPIRGDAENKFVKFTVKDNGITFKCIDEDLVEHWEVFIPELSGFQNVRAITLDSATSGVLILGQMRTGAENDFYGIAIILSNKGEIKYTKKFKEKTILNDGLIINPHKFLIVGGINSNGEIIPFVEIIDLDCTQQIFTTITENTYKLPKVGQRFKNVFFLSESVNKISLIVSNYENAAGITRLGRTEVSQLSVMELEIDSAIRVKWENILFKKSGLYSPQVSNFIARYDMINKRIFASYSLANDEVLSARLFSLSMDGNLLWKKELIQDEYTFLMDIVPDTSKIYFSGAIQTNVPKHPFVISYSLAIAGSITLDGNAIKMIKYGKFRSISYDEFYKITVKDSTVEIVHNHSGRLLGSTILNGENSFARITFSKKDL